MLVIVGLVIKLRLFTEIRKVMRMVARKIHWDTVLATIFVVVGVIGSSSPA